MAADKMPPPPGIPVSAITPSLYLGRILGAAPRSRILVTSRTRLRLQAEHDFPLEPLRVLGDVPVGGSPHSGPVPHGSAVELFLMRAEAAGAQLARRTCARRPRHLHSTFPAGGFCRSPPRPRLALAPSSAVARSNATSSAAQADSRPAGIEIQLSLVRLLSCIPIVCPLLSIPGITPVGGAGWH